MKVEQPQSPYHRLLWDARTQVLELWSGRSEGRGLQPRTYTLFLDQC